MSWKAALRWEDDSETEVPGEFDSSDEAFNSGLDWGDENYDYSKAIRVWNEDNPDDDTLYTQA